MVKETSTQSRRRFWKSCQAGCSGLARERIVRSLPGNFGFYRLCECLHKAGQRTASAGGIFSLGDPVYLSLLHL